MTRSVQPRTLLAAAIAGVLVTAAALYWYFGASRLQPVSIETERPILIEGAYHFAREIRRPLIPLGTVWRLHTREALAAPAAPINGAGMLDPLDTAPSPYISAALEIPPAASLSFEISATLPEGVPRGDSVVFRIQVEDVAKQDRNTIYEQAITPHSVREPNRWNPASIRLDEFAGHTLRFIFTTEPASALGGQGKAQALWGVPMVTAAAPAAAPKKPNVILISLDTLRADRLGCYGFSRATSPHLDAFAGAAHLFENCFSPSSWTLPAHVAVMTGLHPGAHESNSPDGKTMPANAQTLAELAASRGYRTAAFTGGAFVAQEWGFARGFERYNFYTKSQTGDAIGDSLAWLRSLVGAPFFLFFHTYAVHEPYTPPAEYIERFADPGYDGPLVRQFTFEDRDFVLGLTEADKRQVQNLYLAEIAHVDAMLGYLFGQLKKDGLWNDTLVVLFSDHGEEFWEHGRWGHGVTLYDEQLHVPLIIKLPAQSNASRIPELISLVDVFATVSGALGVRTAQADDALDLMPLMTGAQVRPARPYVVSEVGFRDDPWARIPSEPARRSIRTVDTKLIRNPSDPAEERYDLLHDPSELSSLAAPQAPAPDDLGRTLDAFLDSTNSSRQKWVAGQQQAEIADLSEELEALGYL